MKRFTDQVRLTRSAWVLPALLLLAPGIARAQTSYKVEAIVKPGDPVGDLVIKKGADFLTGSLNDNGQVVFVTQATPNRGTVLQYANGKFTPIVLQGQPTPDGRRKFTGNFFLPVHMNQSGDVVVGCDDATYRWDFKTQQLTPVAQSGMPAVNGLTFAIGGADRPAINDRGEIAFVAKLKGTTREGIFFQGQDGKILPVALPDQELPGGAKIERAFWPSLNEAGAVAFMVQRPGELFTSAYLWENGTITPVAVKGAPAPGGGTLGNIVAAWVNSKDRSVLVAEAAPTFDDTVRALYRFAEGQLTPVVLKGQQMPDGRTFQAIAERGALSVSESNQAGQHAFVARVQGGFGIYLLEPDSKLSLILKNGVTTDLGTTIAYGGSVGGDGIGLNTKGQVAVTVRFSGGVNALVLLTPVAP
jgi:hypothetical protein